MNFRRQCSGACSISRVRWPSRRLKACPGDKLLQFAGMMTPEEAREFLQSIEEDCERIEPGEW